MTKQSVAVNQLSTWSVDQRLEQLIMVSGQFSDLAASGPAASAGVGGFVLFGQPPAGSGPAIASGLSALAADAAAAGQVRPWMSTDEEGGSIARLSQVIGLLPTPRQMAAQLSTAQVEATLAAHGPAMQALGVNMDLAPVLDTAAPTNIIADENDRSFSENGQVAGAYGVAFANGLRSSGVVPVVKHFPGLGHASANTDLGPATDPPLSQLGNDLLPFSQAISQGLPAVMVGHPIVPGLTGGLPASLSPATYQLLRNNLGFGGMTITDSLAAGAISGAGYSEASAAVTAIESGADMVMISATAWQPTLAAFRQAVSAGALPLAAVDASVTRILSAKALVVARPSYFQGTNGLLEAFVEGANNTLLNYWWDPATGWHSVGIGTTMSAPAAFLESNGQLQVMVQDPNSNLVNYWWDPASGWHSVVLGTATSAPAYFQGANGLLEVFVQGANGALVNYWWDPASGWHSIGIGTTASAPTGFVGANGLLEVMVQGSNSGLVNYWWDPAGGWHSVAIGTALSTPAAFLESNGLLQVMVQGSNNQLVNYWWDSARGWLSVGIGATNTTPAFFQGANGLLQVFVQQGANGTLANYWWDPASGWHSVGVGTTGSPPAGFMGSSGFLQILVNNSPLTPPVNYWWDPAHGWRSASI